MELTNPFAKLRFKGKKTKTKGLPFSEDFIRDRLLADGALDGLNEDARDVLLVMVNTGARPSEIVGCASGAWQLSADVPHLDISQQIPRVLKTEMAPRQIPLLGFSLQAAKRIATRGGIHRYIDNADNWSAAVNKYLTKNRLRETPQHTAYSLGSRLIDDQSQNMTVAARATAERKVFAHRS